MHSQSLAFHRTLVCARYAVNLKFTCGNLVTERMGQWGLYLLTMWEVAPEVVSTTMAEALTCDETGYDCTLYSCTLLTL